MSESSAQSSTSSTTIAGAPAPSNVTEQIRRGDRVQVDVSVSSVARILFVIALFGAGLWMLRELSTLIIQFSIALFLAIAADPLVRRLEARGVGRGKSIVAVMLAVVVVVGGILSIFVPPLIDQGNKFADAAPGLVSETRDSEIFHRIDEEYDVVDKASEQAEKLPGIVSDQLGTVVSAVLAGVVGTITILFLTIFLLSGGGHVARGTVRVFPRLVEKRWWTVIEGAYTGISAYVGGAIIIALIGGSSLALVCFFLGLPYALPLGLWMMLLEIIPLIGATIGAIPAIIVAFIAGGVWQGLAMVAFIIVYQQIENIVIQPRVQGRAASLSPLVVFLSVLIGSQLLGVLGALFAIPVAGVCQIIVRQLVEQQGSDDLEMPALISGGPEAAAYVQGEMKDARTGRDDHPPKTERTVTNDDAVSSDD